MAGANNVLLSAGVSCLMGTRRSNNEDNFFLDGRFKSLEQADISVEWSTLSPHCGVYAVCDGMGGQAHGERAAWMCAHGLSLAHKRFFAEDVPLKSLVERCIKAINASIVQQNKEHMCQMGSTLAMVVFCEDRYHVFNLGDSRVYLYSEGVLTQLSKDHTEAQALADMGIRSPLLDPGVKSGALIQYLGVPDEEMILEPHYAVGTLSPGERLLLCSDGLTDALSHDSIAHTLSLPDSPAVLASRLSHAAEYADARDNITALVIALSSQSDEDAFNRPQPVQ